MIEANFVLVQKSSRRCLLKQWSLGTSQVSSLKGGEGRKEEEQKGSFPPCEISQKRGSIDCLEFEKTIEPPFLFKIKIKNNLSRTEPSIVFDFWSSVHNAEYFVKINH